MKCEATITNLKNKKEAALRCQGELKTLRTFAEGKSVRRERRCDQCGRRLWTVEMYESDLELERKERNDEILRLKQELRGQNGEVERVKEAVKTLFVFAGNG